MTAQMDAFDSGLWKRFIQMADPSNSTTTEKDMETKEHVDAVKHSENSPRHDKETHGKRDDIDEDTPVDEVKGPGVFQRVKEEVEAVVEAILHKK